MPDNNNTKQIQNEILENMADNVRATDFLPVICLAVKGNSLATFRSPGVTIPEAIECLENSLASLREDLLRQN